MMKLATAALALLLSTMPAKATEPPPLRAQIMQTEPWGYFNDHRLTGIWPEIADLIEKESGVPHRKSLAPYSRVIQNLDAGDIDVSYLIKSPDRASVIHAGLLFNFGAVVIAREGVQVERYEDLDGLRIGVLRGIRLSHRFDADANLHKIEVRDYETMVNMLAEGRLDAISGNSLSLPYLARKLGGGASLGKRLVLQVTPVTVQFSARFAGSPVVDAVKEAVDRLRARGDIAAVLDRWAGPEWRVD